MGGSHKMRAEVVGIIKEFDGALLIVLEAPICARVGDKVGICRQSKKSEWSFIGGGIIRKTKNLQIESDNLRKLNFEKCELCLCRWSQRNGPFEISAANESKRDYDDYWTAEEGELQKTDDSDEQVIQIQGDLRTEIAKMIEKLGIVKKAQIVVHGF